MREQLKRLEHVSRRLEPSPEKRQTAERVVLGYSEDFLDRIETLKAYETGAGKGEHLLESPISENGIGIDEAIELIRENHIAFAN